MSENPKVSIIIPVYNTEKYVKNALESVANQSYSNVEAIVINDGSTDASGEIASQFCSGDERFFYVEQKNAGVSSARNKGLEKATGEFVAFLDSDDIMPEDAIMSMVTCAEDKNSDMVIGNIKYISESGTRYLTFAEKLSKKQEIDKLDIDLTYNLKVINKLFKTSVINENNLRFGPFAIDEDGVFLYDYLIRCNKIAGCSNTVVDYYHRLSINGNSLSESKDIDRISSMINAMDSIIGKANELLRNDEIGGQEDTAKRYIGILVTRLIYLEIIGKYRNIWTSEEILELLNNKLEEYKKYITEYAWEKIKKKNKDIDLKNNLKSKEELAANPLIAVIIDDKIPKNELNIVLKGLYSQKVSSFNVYIKENQMKHVSNEYAEKENFCIVENNTFSRYNRKHFRNVMNKAKAKYVLLIGDALFADSDAVKNMFDELDGDEKLDMVFGNVIGAEKKAKKTIMTKRKSINSQEHLLSFASGKYELFSSKTLDNAVFFSKKELQENDLIQLV